MKIYCKGAAIIRHKVTGITYKIEANELEWDTAGSHERSMGPEIAYEASIEHEELGLLTWTIHEYPAGAENHTDIHLNGHKLIENFDYGLEHEGEWGEEYEDNFIFEYFITSYTENYIKKFSASRKSQFLVKWFLYFFEDPVHSLPYESREGGYQWVYGGPYEADDELFANFSDIVSEDIINNAINELTNDGTHFWSPTDYHPKRSGLEEALNLIHAKIKSGIKPKLGHEKEKEKRKQFSRAINEFQEVVQSGYVGIGHNAPPEEIENEYEHKIGNINTNSAPQNIINNTINNYGINLSIGNVFNIDIKKIFDDTLNLTSIFKSIADNFSLIALDDFLTKVKERSINFIFSDYIFRAANVLTQAIDWISTMF